MAKKKKASKKKASNKKTGVEPFNDEINDEVQEGDDMAGKVSQSRRRRIEAEAAEEADEDTENEDEEDEVTDEADEDEVEDDDDEEIEDEETEPVDLGFAPFIIHDNAEWTLEDVIDEAEPGETIYFFRPPGDDETPAKWYKLQPVEVGEK